MLNQKNVTLTGAQHVTLRHTSAVLIGLTILNLFNQFWEHVFIDNFLISILAAILLQSLLQLTVWFEKKCAFFFSSGDRLKAKLQRVFTTGSILIISKFIILGITTLLFGDYVIFSGPANGLIAFVVVIMTILMLDHLFLRAYFL